MSRLSFPGQISFTEMMFASKGGTDTLPQWIELCNASETETVNLHGWHLEIEGSDASGVYQHASIRLKDLMIYPKQVGLIVTADAPNTAALPDECIYHFFKHHRNAFGRYTDPKANNLIGQNGLFLKLSDPSRQVSDMIGNLDGDKKTADAPTWELHEGSITDGTRTSLLRRYDPDEDTPIDGTRAINWNRAVEMRLEILTYYGDETDIGNPGHKDQGSPYLPLPRVSFSELMLASKGGLHSLPQWIELYNDSETEPVNLRGWRLKIESLDPTGEHRHAFITLKEVVIPPKQTALIVTYNGRHSRDISMARVYNFYLYHRDAFDQHDYQHRNKIFGQHGFFLKLYDADGGVRDIAGNLDGDPATQDAPKWTLPSLKRADGERTSLIRRYARATGMPLDGKAAANWASAAEMPSRVMPFWGRSADIGTPGWTNEALLHPRPQMHFSEFLFTSRGGLHSLPQWIEVHNDSETEPVNLRGWHLEIEARDEDGGHRHMKFQLKELIVPPRQVALLVTSRGRVSRSMPIARLYDLRIRHAKVFQDHRALNKVIGRHGFFFQVSDPDGYITDTMGNLDGAKETLDMPMWDLPSDKVTDGARGSTDGARVSLMRQYNALGMPRDGTASESWVLAANLPLDVMSYYGWETDIGNPGYVNAAVRLRGHQVSFSEMMFPTRVGWRSGPQWIELYNDSDTEIVNLKGWSLEIEGLMENGEYGWTAITFKDLVLRPNEIALLVTGNAPNAGNIPPRQIYNLPSHHPNAFRRLRDSPKILGDVGFFLKLTDAEGAVSDIVGNLDGDSQTRDAPIWDIPSGETPDGVRVSLMRRYYHVTGIPLDGRRAANWVPASNLPLTVTTYYGRETDISNPGYRGGGPLPVILSSFRAARTDTKAVVLNWTTESEKDNAGFHILRGQTRQGPFVKITPRRIAGRGTTSERHTYTWTDTTAQPNIAYYYRLEDVSFTRQQRQLATVRLRGDVSPKGKLVTTWSRLKRQNIH